VERILGKQRYSAVYQADAGIFPVKDQAPESRDDLKPKLQKQEVDSFLCVCSWRSANTRSYARTALVTFIRDLHTS
jgi:hypothetical protein